MNIRKVYKKENLCRGMDNDCVLDNCITKAVTDIIIIDSKYFCKIQGSRIIQATRIHWTTNSTAIDLDGHKYTFADSCFMISPMNVVQSTVQNSINDKRIIVEDNYDTIIVPKIWTIQELYYKNQYIDFGRPLYSLCTGTWITLFSIRVMIVETILQEDAAIIETDINTILVTGSSFSIIDRC